MSEKTWVYWVGLIIVAFAVVGIIGGLTGLIAPIPRFPHLRPRAAVDLILVVHRVAAMKLVGAIVFLVAGVYMMIKGKS